MSANRLLFGKEVVYEERCEIKENIVLGDFSAYISDPQLGFVAIIKLWLPRILTYWRLRKKYDRRAKEESIRRIETMLVMNNLSYPKRGILTDGFECVAYVERVEDR